MLAAAYGFKMVTFTAFGTHMIVCGAGLHTNVTMARMPLAPTVVTSLHAGGCAVWACMSVTRWIRSLISLLSLVSLICAAGSSRSATLTSGQLPYGAAASLLRFDYSDSTL